MEASAEWALLQKAAAGRDGAPPERVVGLGARLIGLMEECLKARPPPAPLRFVSNLMAAR